jgi:hypothetical protein
LAGTCEGVSRLSRLFYSCSNRLSAWDEAQLERLGHADVLELGRGGEDFRYREAVT